MEPQYNPAGHLQEGTQEEIQEGIQEGTQEETQEGIRAEIRVETREALQREEMPPMDSEQWVNSPLSLKENDRMPNVS